MIPFIPIMKGYAILFFNSSNCLLKKEMCYMNTYVDKSEIWNISSKMR